MTLNADDVKALKELEVGYRIVRIFGVDSTINSVHFCPVMKGETIKIPYHVDRVARTVQFVAHTKNERDSELLNYTYNLDSIQYIETSDKREFYE